METSVRAAMLTAAALSTLWMHYFVASVESAWTEAHAMRLSLLANPSSARAEYCQPLRDQAETHRLCEVKVLVKTQDHGWGSLCRGAFTKASRWYDIQLRCKAPLGKHLTMVAKSKIWR